MDLLWIEKKLMRQWVGELPAAAINEMAIPSYYHWNPLIRWLFKRRLICILQMATNGPHRMALDFGCGTGLFGLNLARHCEQVFLHDLECSVVEQVVRHFSLRNVRVVAGAAWPDSIPAGVIDVIVAADVLEHVNDLSAVVDDFDSLLAPHGRAIVSGPTEHAFYRLGRLLAGFRNEYHVRNVADLRRHFLDRGYTLCQERHLPVRRILDAFHIMSFSAPARGGG